MSKLFAGMFSLVLATLVLGTAVFADVAVGETGVGAEPGDQDPRICVKHREVTIGYDADPVGINALKYRTGMYAFAGEQIKFHIVVRDPNGALDIGFPKIRVAGAPEVLCNELSEWPTSENWNWNNNCDGMGPFNTLTDRRYECFLTVEPQWDGEKEVKITAYNSAFEPTDGTHVETWFFNPALSMSVSTSDGMAIHFEEMPYGANDVYERTVHSLNRLQVKNTAEGGVNMWMYLAGTDLYDPSGASKCPTTNVLDIKQMQYRGWSGTQWHSNEGWQVMGKYDQDAICQRVLGTYTGNQLSSLTCYGGKPVPYDTNVDYAWKSHLLTNQGNLEVEFKLTYPMPCVGTFSQGSLLVFGKAI